MRLYTQKQLQWLSCNIFGTPYARLTARFNRQFGLNKSVNQIKDTCKYHGLYNGRKEESYRPIGSERIESDGYVRVKTGRPKTWKHKHRVVWEAVNGPVPKGYIVMFADKNKFNFQIGNLILVRRREMAYMNRFGMFSSNPDITKTNLLIVRHRLLISEKVNKLAGNNLRYSIADKFRRAKAKRARAEHEKRG